MKKQGIKKYELRSRIITTIVVALIGMIFVLPLIWMISASLLTDAQVYEYPFQWLPAAPRWQNYREIYTSSIVSLPRMYLNSLTIAVASIAGVLLISALAAHAFACISFPGKNIVFALFIGVMMIPTQVTIIPRFLLFKTIGIYNTLWSVILPSFFSVTSIFLMRQFFMSLPVSLRESAFLDGAGHLRILMQIVLPLAKPTIASLIIINFITSWNDYFSPLIFLKIISDLSRSDKEPKRFSFSPAHFMWLFAVPPVGVRRMRTQTVLRDRQARRRKTELRPF